MIEGTLSQVADSMHGILLGDDVAFRGVSTDTRTINEGELFVALQGPNFDGNEFVELAEAGKAAAAVVSGSVRTSLPNVVVDDTRIALGELAAAWRSQMPATVVGITGSNGKTTLKELITACLGATGNTLATEGNLNNEIGLPLMLLRLSSIHRFAVMEMGANHAGEIDYLASLARPDLAVITNAGPAHLEGFGSIEGVAHAKGEILQSLTANGTAVLNRDDVYYEFWCGLCGDAAIRSFGLSSQADVYATAIVERADGSSFELHTGDDVIDVNLRLPGVHNVLHACAAAAVCGVLGLTIAEVKSGLESAAPASARLNRLAGLNGSALYDDSYNANPASVEAAARFLAARAGDSIIVLGDMAELGDDSAAIHASVGGMVRAAGVDLLLATGEMSRHTVEGFGSGAHWLPDVDAIVDFLSQQLNAGSNVLVKGSRSARMGRVVRALLAPATNGEAA